MSHLVKSQSKGYFRNIPLGLFEQYFGFFGQAAVDDFGGASAGGFLQNLIQMIDVYAQTGRKVQRRFELNFLHYALNRKLSF